MGITTEEATKINVSETAGENCCVAACDGQKIYDKTATALSQNKKVELSFAGTDDLTPAFLNSAVGQLYGSFPVEVVENNLSFADLAEEDDAILKRVIERAKTYFEHAGSGKKTLTDILEDEDA